MSADAQQLRQCGKKITYPTRESAEYGAAAMRNKTHKRVKFDVYDCAFCSGFHVGRKRTKEQGIRRAVKNGAVIDSVAQIEQRIAACMRAEVPDNSIPCPYCGAINLPKNEKLCCPDFGLVVDLVVCHAFGAFPVVTDPDVDSH